MLIRRFWMEKFLYDYQDNAVYEYDYDVGCYVYAGQIQDW